MKRLLGSVLVLAFVLAAQPTALDRYVQAPDSSYRYQLVTNRPGTGYTRYVLDMTSQSWRAASEVNRALWRHWVTIIRPEKVEGETALLFITGGSNDGKPPERPDPMLLNIALTTNTVVAEVRLVPNQPLVFSDDKKPRREDEIIAYTWDKFLRGGDETWPLRLPMTKAAVRAMDAVTAFCATPEGGGIKVRKFVVAGASKRGWTTWTTAAADRRVVAIAPIVIDVLNVEKALVHHWRAYGFWAPAIQNYVEMRIVDWFDTPQMKALLAIEDPYSYRDRLTMPKLILSASGDQFFLPDSWQFYYDALKGEKQLRYVPNADHSLKNTDAQQTLAAFYDSVAHNRPRPRFEWGIEKDGTIRVKTIDTPSEVRLWQATNPNARDFRLEEIGPAYQSSVLAEQGGGVYVAKIPKPEKGFTAAFVELTYPTGGKYPLKLTTGVKVIPDVYPFPAYQPAPLR